MTTQKDQATTQSSSAGDLPDRLEEREYDVRQWQSILPVQEAVLERLTIGLQAIQSQTLDPHES